MLNAVPIGTELGPLTLSLYTGATVVVGAWVVGAAVVVGAWVVGAAVVVGACVVVTFAPLTTIVV